MKLLITGGAGFIGSNLIRYFMENHEDWHIVNLDKLTYAGNLQNLQDVACSYRYQFVRGCITDSNLLDELFNQHDFAVVLNLAAESHVDRSILDPSAFVKTNVLGTQVLLEACRKHRVGKFVQISTDEVYGSLGPDERAFTEDTPLCPNSPYAASKAAADLMVRAYCQTYGLNGIITRCSNNYGPYQFPEKLLPLMITNALEGRPLPVYGDGQNIRDWIHVKDHCRALELVIDAGVGGEVYNVGSSCELTNLEVVKMILQALNKPDTMINFVSDRLGHDRRYAINATKIKTQLGWVPHYQLHDFLPLLVSWYRDNYPWWQKIRSGEA